MAPGQHRRSYGLRTDAKEPVSRRLPRDLARFHSQLLPWPNQTKIESLERRNLAPADIAVWDPEAVPGVDMIEALTAAAQAFGAQRLGLQVDPNPATGRPPAAGAVAARGDRSASRATRPTARVTRSGLDLRLTAGGPS